MLINKSLRNLLLALTITLPGSFLATPLAWANHGFKVINQSGKEIFYLYIVEYDATRWGRDLLQKDILKPQQQRTFYLPRYHKCDYLVRAVFYNRNEITDRINLCDNTNVRINNQTIETN